ncbi:type II toxin-antitoxin system RelE/ParE family toxin [Thiocystis violacea]|uniref:type II toxin-antitoxin system RelE/ParE family toxin n=1 Tax=Thiocystis violacea TaxID=13725 RepID=UPI001902F504|nr:type II toxin-antitoxin system RelE/ParE family toxin [Thiocystis violacea]MBK1724348.1 hypothetical protein [Thiocystis violacea]
MAGELIWSRTALDDIEAIAGWIARDSMTHARDLVERIVARSEALLTETSRPQLLLDLDAIRVLERPLEGFRILYERHGDDLHLLAVIHRDGAQPAN